MAVQKKIKAKKKLLDAINYFKELPSYNTYTEKPKIKCLKTFDLPSHVPFYEELSVVKTNKVFEDMQ